MLQARTVTRQNSPTAKSSRENTGPVPAGDRVVSKAEEINALLTRPIAILPIKVGDPIRPFALGLWNEIRCLLRPAVSVSTLRKATGAYIYSRSYQIAVARRDSSRHDINGAPIDFVSDADRLDAQQKYESFRMRDGKRKPNACAPLALPTPPTKTDMIRAALLERRRSPTAAGCPVSAGDGFTTP